MSRSPRGSRGRVCRGSGTFTGREHGLGAWGGLFMSERSTDSPQPLWKKGRGRALRRKLPWKKGECPGRKNAMNGRPAP